MCTPIHIHTHLRAQVQSMYVASTSWRHPALKVQCEVIRQEVAGGQSRCLIERTLADL